MDKAEAIALLDKLTGADQEIDHGFADEILCKYLRAIGHAEVADAWDRACERVGFWYA